MKKILILILLTPTLLFSQISSWRNNSGSNHNSNTTPRYNPPQSNRSEWRNSPPKNDQYITTNPKPHYGNGYDGNYGHHNNHYNNHNPYYNRWYYWGAPSFGYNYWAPGYYYNNWGYREPYRVYYYENNRVDTVKGEQTHFSFGIQGTTDNQVGGWITIGNRGYFIMEYSTTNKRDNSTFFQNGTLSQVDFPLVGDLKKLNSFYIGGGKKIKRTGFHVMLGVANEIVRYRGIDNIGYITFPKYNNSFISAKFGVLHDFKNVTTKIDYEPTLRNLSLGIGVNF
jgi:hypothetical protein